MIRGRQLGYIPEMMHGNTLAHCDIAYPYIHDGANNIHGNVSAQNDDDIRIDGHAEAEVDNRPRP